jgi:ABC-type transporter Mla subunit MlaD
MDNLFQTTQQRRMLYGVIAVGIVVIGGLAILSLSLGGLPGTTNSPSAVVHGRSTAGSAGAD